MRRNHITAFILVVVSLCACAPAIADDYTRFQAEPPFDSCLLASPLLMEIGGARGFRMDDGRIVVLSVASTTVEDDSAADRLRMIKICRAKAAANILKEQQGIEVHTVTHQEDKTVMVIKDGIEYASNVTELLDMVREEARGRVHSLPVVATWYSSDHRLFYLAIGEVASSSRVPRPPISEEMP